MGSTCFRSAPIVRIARATEKVLAAYRRRAARNRPPASRQPGAAPKPSPTRRAREGTHRSHPNGDNEQNHDEGNPEQVHITHSELQRIFGPVWSPSIHSVYA